MFNSNSSYNTSQLVRQQVIALNQSYPCPRCNCGVLETYGLTETLKCNGCSRSFVPLRNGRCLYPANRMGFKIAPTYWWDGLHWHWAGTTATATQLAVIVSMFIIPLMALNGAFHYGHLWADRPEWLSPALLSAVVSLVTIQAIYFTCWDFDFVSRRRAAR